MSGRLRGIIECREPGAAIVSFFSEKDAKSALERNNGKTLNDHKLIIRFAPMCKNSKTNEKTHKDTLSSAHEKSEKSRMSPPNVQSVISSVKNNRENRKRNERSSVKDSVTTGNRQSKQNETNDRHRQRDHASKASKRRREQSTIDVQSRIKETTAIRAVDAFVTQIAQKRKSTSDIT